MLTVLFVCSGNTCRSPMAEALFNHLVHKNNMNGKMMAFSAGLAACEGMPASKEACRTMNASGVNLENHKACRFNRHRAEKADIILTMTATHKKMILMLYPDLKDKVHTVSEFVGENSDIADPFGRGLDEYKCCAQQLDKLITLVYQKLVKLAG